ncbi:hypothetical protein [Burkholderia sp. Bp8994]|uniref:hypothetical protein n=1 Tax=Burkholderia sp. Bp8994 TaxID=2184555 RepID=UPI0016296D6C|nr:hypothetical protein [Burkholderia sp. Bp8994]
MRNVEQDVIRFRHTLRERSIETFDEIERRAGNQRIPIAEQRVGRRRERLDDRRRIAVLPEAGPQCIDLIQCRSHAVLRRFLVARLRVERQPTVVQGHQHGIDLRAIDRRIRRKGFLHDLPVVPRHDLQRDAMTRGAGDERQHEMIERAVADQPEPERRERRERAPRALQGNDRAPQLDQLIFAERAVGQLA